MNRIRLAVAGVLLSVVVAVVAACAQPGTGPSAPRTHAADEVVLRVEYTDGFMLVQHMVTRLPVVTVYGDGRVITEGPIIAIYPSPALPNIAVQRISAADVDRLVDRALDAGVGRDIDLGHPPVADAPGTRFSVLTEEGLRVTDAYALGIGDNVGLTAEQRAARESLGDLLSALTDLPGEGGVDVISEQQEFAPSALAAVAVPWIDPGDDSVPEPAEVAWPGPTLPGEPLMDRAGLSCVTVRAEVTEVLAAAGTANVLTPWVSGGQRWSVTLRPLLPDETGCSDLVGMRRA